MPAPGTQPQGCTTVPAAGTQPPRVHSQGSAPSNPAWTPEAQGTRGTVGDGAPELAPGTCVPPCCWLCFELKSFNFRTAPPAAARGVFGPSQAAVQLWPQLQQRRSQPTSTTPGARAAGRLQVCHLISAQLSKQTPPAPLAPRAKKGGKRGKRGRPGPWLTLQTGREVFGELGERPVKRHGAGGPGGCCPRPRPRGAGVTFLPHPHAEALLQAAVLALVAVVLVDLAVAVGPAGRTGQRWHRAAP